MPVASLDGVYAKLERARRHLAEFEGEVARVPDVVRRAAAFETTYDRAANLFRFRLVRRPVLPVYLSTIAGDVGTNLRSALDYLAYELIVLATGEAWDDTQWPILVKREAVDKSRTFRGMRERLLGAGRDNLWAMIDFYQAFDYFQNTSVSKTGYIMSDRVLDLPLFWLADLNNRDKHRLLLEPYVSDSKESADWNPT